MNTTKTRYFRRIGGFEGPTKLLGFHPDGTVSGYKEDNSDDGDYTGLYHIVTAEQFLKDGHWEELNEMPLP